VSSPLVPDIGGRDLSVTSSSIAQPVSLGHRPHGQWIFDEQVSDCFDDMLMRSIPGYAAMRSVTSAVAARYYQPGTAVIDLGCSRGGALAALLQMLPQIDHAVGIEISQPMREAALGRFAGDSRVNIMAMDLRHEYPAERSSVVLAVLTLQFIPIEHRPGLLAAIRDHLTPGGVMIIAEKLLGSTPEVHDTLTELYYDHKRAAGYSEGDIAAKRVSLEGVLVPISERENLAALAAAGFCDIECIWRHLNFGAWMARVPAHG
jgi:tRNA (cmo5U34)-methyltransferase